MNKILVLGGGSWGTTLGNLLAEKGHDVSLWARNSKIFKKVKNYWVWSDFAQKDMHKLGFKHVETVHGAIDDKDFYRLSDMERRKLRREKDIDSDDFVIGFVFRNQLRKSVPNLLAGYKQFKQENPQVKTKLLLHTHWDENPHGDACA